MKTARKVLILALCAVLLVSTTVMGTLAYLTSKDSVTNTFTVGKVKITLDEADVNLMGEEEKNEEGELLPRVKENDYHLLPGHTYKKDPTIHVDANSEDCWLFVKIVNEIVDIEAETTVADQMAAKGWTLVAGTTNIYAHEDIAEANDNVVVFESFKIKGEVTNTQLAPYLNKTIVVTAYAIQADGFDTAAEAWTAGGTQAQENNESKG